MIAPPHLSPRQRQVLDCRAQGLAYKEIGPRLGISFNTVKSYLAQTFEILNASSSIQAIRNLQISDRNLKPRLGAAVVLN
jgi:DNA-binding NarL/FixJ family response regulator